MIQDLLLAPGADLLDVAMGLCHATDDPLDRSLWAALADLARDYPALSRAYRIVPLGAGLALYLTQSDWAAVWRAAACDDITEFDHAPWGRLLVFRGAVEVVTLYPVGSA
jgi:hypothetical protein